MNVQTPNCKPKEIGMDATTILPAPDRERRFPLGSYDRKPRRSIEFSWDLLTRDNGDQVALTLSCYHHSGRGYSASVNNELQQTDGVTGCMPFNARSVASERVERYNKRRFEEFAARALARLTEVAHSEFGDFMRGEQAPHR